MSDSAFAQVAKTYVLIATPTSDQPTPITLTDSDVNQYRVYNSGIYTVFITFAQTKQKAIDLSGIPEDGEPAFSIPVTPGAVEIFSGPEDGWIAAYTDGGTSKVYVTPGRGM